MSNIKSKIICGNNVNILQKFPEGCIDLTVTSPPYDDLRDYNGFTFDLKTCITLAKQLYRVTKDGGVVVWVVADQVKDGSESGTSFKHALHFIHQGFNLHDTMIYTKSGFSNPSNVRYHQIFEYMFVFSKGKPKTFNPIKDKRNKDQYNYGKGRRQKDGSMSNKNDKSRIYLNKYGMRFNVWRYVTGKGNSTRDEIAYEHDAIFPELLARDHIYSWSQEGNIVLDPFCGSGTTCKMAYLLRRKFIGIDVSQEYCDITKERLKMVKGQSKPQSYWNNVYDKQALVKEKKGLQEFF